jgi:hypothetical protein
MVIYGKGTKSPENCRIVNLYTLSSLCTLDIYFKNALVIF